MKKIIMLVSKIASPNKVDFISRVSKYFKSEISLELGDIHDISLYFGETNEVFCGSKDLKNFDLVIFRGITADDRSLASAVAIMLDLNGVSYIDKIYGRIGTSENKLASLSKLYLEGLPIPVTFYTSGPLNKTVFEKISAKIGLPFVAKDLLKQRGLGVSLIKGFEGFSKLEGTQIFQKLIEKDHEYRVLVLGDDVGVFEEKIASNPNEFRNNVALGAHEVFLDKNDASEKIREVSVKSARALSLDIAGVDVITERETGKVYLLEANRGPGMTYSEESPEFKEIANYLEKHA